MDTFERLAERLSLPIARALALVHIVLLAWFLAVLMAAMDQARAETAPCTGQDLMPKIEAASPGATARMQAEADRTPNGKGLLWRIDKQGAAPSWLFGTMHLSDPRVTRLPAAAQKAFDAAGTVVIETTDVLDQAKFAAQVAADPSLTMYTGKDSLKTVLPADRLAEVEAALKRRGIPLMSVVKMKPWLLTTMLAAPDCEVSRQMSGLAVLDWKLARDAQAAGKEVQGLENGLDQIRAMDSVPVEFHIKGLIGLLQIDDERDNLFETMTRLYLQGQTGMFKPLFRESDVLAPGLSGGMDNYAEFEQVMVDKRNLTMADNAAPILAEGNAFIAVGALHLPGEKGLVEEFRRRGFAVSAVD